MLCRAGLEPGDADDPDVPEADSDPPSDFDGESDDE